MAKSKDRFPFTSSVVTVSAVFGVCVGEGTIQLWQLAGGAPIGVEVVGHTTAGASIAGYVIFELQTLLYRLKELVRAFRDFWHELSKPKD